MLKNIGEYPYLIAIVLAWFSAHIIKYIIKSYKKEKCSFRSQLFISGDMPSSHSATVMSVLTIIGLVDGFDSGLFGLGAILALIIMYDAVKVRRSSGEQGIALVELIKEQKSKVKDPLISKGHQPIEVIAGAFLGVIIGIIVFLATK